MHTQHRGHRDDHLYQPGRNPQFQGNQSNQGHQSNQGNQLGLGGRFEGQGNRSVGRGGQQQVNQFRPDRGLHRPDRGSHFNIPDRGGSGWQGGYGHESDRGGGREFGGFEGGADHGRWDRDRQLSGSLGHGFWPRNQAFVGKGPKGYSRSDERIRDEICELLSEGYLDASDIEVVVLDGEVTLSGTVMDRRTKRIAEEIADFAHGVKDIQNLLKVHCDTQSKTARTEGQKKTPQVDDQSGNYNPSASVRRSFV